MKEYACIKNTVVENVLLFEDDVAQDFLDHVKEEFSYDELVLNPNLFLKVGFTYDGTNFYDNGILVVELFENPPAEPVDESELTQEEIDHLQNIIDNLGK